MPVSKENAVRYPIEWPEISFAVKWFRALGRCECTGWCGLRHDTPTRRCPALAGVPSRPGTRGVVLTTAHLDHQPENVHPANLRAACEACHLRYDAPHHAETRRAARARELERAGVQPLRWDLP